jgi:hypothetical protein
VRRWGDVTCLGQDADTFGQRALLRVVPERGFAMCVMTNSPTGAPVASGLIERVVGDLLDLAPDALDPLAGLAREAGAGGGGAGSGLAALDGTYDRLHQRVVVTSAGGRLRLTTEPSGVLRALGVDAVIGMTPVAGPDAAGRVVAAGPDPVSGLREIATFTPASASQPAGVYVQGRLHRRTA